MFFEPISRRYFKYDPDSNSHYEVLETGERVESQNGSHHTSGNFIAMIFETYYLKIEVSVSSFRELELEANFCYYVLISSQMSRSCLMIVSPEYNLNPFPLITLARASVW